jgi:hypothetical protein
MDEQSTLPVPFRLLNELRKVYRSKPYQVLDFGDAVIQQLDIPFVNADVRYVQAMVAVDAKCYEEASYLLDQACTAIDLARKDPTQSIYIKRVEEINTCIAALRQCIGTQHSNVSAMYINEDVLY